MHTHTVEPWRLSASPAGWTLFEHDQPVRTPLGAPVGSRYRPLARRMLENIRSFGGHSLLPPTPYGLQVLYLDFARSLPAGQLAPVVRSRLQGHGRTPDDPLARLSTRSLLAVLAFDAQFENPHAGLDVVAGAADLDALAAELCAFVAERRIASGLEGDTRYFAPVAERDEDFCREHCLPTIAPHPSEDRVCLTRTPSRCGTRRMLEGFRFFASFPEE
jgi:hypothetical protein